MPFDYMDGAQRNGSQLMLHSSRTKMDSPRKSKIIWSKKAC